MYTFDNSATLSRVYPVCRKKLRGVSMYEEYDEYERSYGFGFDDEMIESVHSS